MKNVYSVTLRTADGRMYGYPVLASNPLTGTDEDPSAITKAQAKCLTDHGDAGTVQSFSTLAENVVE